MPRLLLKQDTGYSLSSLGTRRQTSQKTLRKGTRYRTCQKSVLREDYADYVRVKRKEPHLNCFLSFLLVYFHFYKHFISLQLMDEVDSQQLPSSHDSGSLSQRVCLLCSWRGGGGGVLNICPVTASQLNSDPHSCQECSQRARQSIHQPVQPAIVCRKYFVQTHQLIKSTSIYLSGS